VKAVEGWSHTLA